MRRALASGVLAVAALVPPVLWLLPSLAGGQAPTFRDQGDFFFPLKLYTVDRLRQRSLPLWNPLSGCGEPWLANAQSGVFYPPTLLFLVPKPGLAAALFLLLHFSIAAWGMWRFCKEEGATDGAALFGASLFVGSGFAASLSAYWNHFGAFAYVPGIAALARSGPRTGRGGAALALLVGLQAMAGSPELTAATLGISLLLAWRPRPSPATGWREPDPARIRKRWIVATGLGLLLAAWVLAPLAELAVHSARRAPLPVGERELGALGWNGLASALGLAESSNFFVASLFVGAAALVAAGAAFLEPERRPLARLLTGIGLAGIVLAAAGPPGSWLRLVPGLDRVRYPPKALAASAFAVAALAALGFDALRFASHRRARVGFAIAAVAGAALSAAGHLDVGARFAAAAACAFLAGLALLPRPGGIPAGVLSTAAALATVVGLGLASRDLFRFAPDAEIRYRGAATAFLAAVPGRTLTPPMSSLAPWAMGNAAFDAASLRREREALLGYTNLLAGVRTVRTASPLPTAGAERIAAEIDAASEPARAAGPASGRVYWSPFQPLDLGSRKVGAFFRAPINPYRPRISFVTRFRIETDPESAWRRVAGGETDPSREVLLDRAPSPPPRSGAPRYVVARIWEDAPERVVAEVASDVEGVVVLTDLAFPGWRAAVDGKAAGILTADGVFRAVAVPAGSHRVEFRYRPIVFYAGAAVSVFALLALGAWSLRGPAPEESGL